MSTLSAIFEAIKEGLLFEGLAKAKRDYLDTGKISLPNFTLLVEKDLTEKKKYIEWICKMFYESKGQPDIDSFDIVAEFNDRLARVPVGQKDISSYKSLDQLRGVVEAIPEVSKSSMKRGVKSITDAKPEDIIHGAWEPNTYILHPKTKVDSIKYGRGSRWCTSSMGDDNRFEQYTSQTRGNNKKFYYVIPSNPPTLTVETLTDEMKSTADGLENPTVSHEQYAKGLYTKIAVEVASSLNGRTAVGHNTYWDYYDRRMEDSKGKRLMAKFGIPL